MEKLKVGIVGMVHGHLWRVLNECMELEQMEVVAASDPNPPLLEKVKKEYGINNTYDSYTDMFAKEELDAVLVYSDNKTVPEITEAAAELGIHVMPEKPMAADLEGAERMLKAAQDNDIVLFINYPTAWNPAIQEALKRTREGFFGEVFQVRNRAGHAGPKEVGCDPYFYNFLYDADRNGAGVLMDFCCYGANISRVFLGKPDSVIGIGGRYVKNYIDVEDNAVLLIEYPNAMGITEACWTQAGKSPYSFVLYGTKGTAAAIGQDKLMISTPDNPDGEVIDVPPLPKGRRNAPEAFARAILEGVELEDFCKPEITRDAQAILEAGLESLKYGKKVIVK